MANKNDMGELVAASMRDILDSEEHQHYFKKAAGKRFCCSCEGKCGSKCPCKDDGCKKSCEPCEKVAKKASKKCCDCSGKCEKECPCDNKCQDCSMCGDGMMAEAVREMIGNLTTISHFQDELGLSDSATATMKAAVAMLDELKKNSQTVDVNNVSHIADLLGDEEDSISLENFDEPVDDARQYEVLQSLPFKDELIESARRRLRGGGPDILEQLRQRGRERSEVSEMPVGNFYPSDSEIEGLIGNIENSDTEMDLASPESMAQTELLPPPRLPAPPSPGPSQEELMHKIKTEPQGFRYLTFDPETRGLVPEMTEQERKTEDHLKALREMDKDVSPSASQDKETVLVAFDRLDAWLSKQAHDDHDFEDEEDFGAELEKARQEKLDQKEMEEIDQDVESYYKDPMVNLEELIENEDNDEPDLGPVSDDELPSLFGLEPELEDWSDADDRSVGSWLIRDLSEPSEQPPNTVRYDGGYNDSEFQDRDDPFGIYQSQQDDPAEKLNVRVGPNDWMDEDQLSDEERLRRLEEVYLNPHGRDESVDPDQLSYENVPTRLEEWADDFEDQSDEETRRIREIQENMPESDRYYGKNKFLSNYEN